MIINITINGVDQTKSRISMFNPTGVMAAVDPSIGDFAEYVADTLRTTAYPPERPKQRYKRTGNFGRAWKAVKHGKGEWKVVNEVTDRRGRIYPGYVSGRAPEDKTQQAYMHVNRWWIARDIVDSLEQKLIDDVVRAIQGI